MTGATISIRDFQPGDMAGITALTNELGYPTTLEQMTARMNTLATQDNYRTFVAVINNQVAGYTGLCKNYFWEQDGHYLRIQALVVNRDHRRQGVGEQLIHAAEQMARQTGAKILLLNCGNREERQAAHQFYREMGFEPKSTGYIKYIQ